MATRTKDQPEELKGAINRPNILRKFTQWRTIKTQMETEAKRVDNLRKWLLAAVEQEGEPDDKGSLYLPLPEPVQGFESLKAERRVTNTLNAEKAEALIRSKGLFDQCTNLVLHVTDQEAAIEALRAAGLLEGQGFDVARELDEEAILRAHYEEHLTQADLDAIFDVKETYAFVPLKG